MRLKSVVIGAVVAAVTASSFAVVHVRPDDLQPFRQYVVSDDTHYYRVQAIAQYAMGSRPPDPVEAPPPILVRTLLIKNITADQLRELVCSDLCQRDHWALTSGRSGAYYLFKQDEDKSITIETPESSRYGMRMLQPRVPDGCLAVTETRNMDKFDVLLLRVQRIGRDPFDKTPTTAYWSTQ